MSLITTSFISAWRVAAAKALFSSVAMSCVFICQRACQCNATPNKSSAAVAMLTMPKPARSENDAQNANLHECPDVLFTHAAAFAVLEHGIVEVVLRDHFRERLRDKRRLRSCRLLPLAGAAGTLQLC